MKFIIQATLAIDFNQHPPIVELLDQEGVRIALLHKRMAEIVVANAMPKLRERLGTPPASPPSDI